MRRTSGSSPKLAPIGHLDRLGKSRTVMLSQAACRRQRVSDAKRRPLARRSPFLPPISRPCCGIAWWPNSTPFNPPTRGAGWAHRSLPTKNTLTAADTDLVEAGFRARLAVFGDERPANGLPEDVQGLPGAQPGQPPVNRRGSVTPPMPSRSMLDRGDRGRFRRLVQAVLSWLKDRPFPDGAEGFLRGNYTL
jgi:hypothetical protein